MSLKRYTEVFRPGVTRLDKRLLVGRDRELQTISRILEHGQKSVKASQSYKHIVITGHRGIGKTSLLDFAFRQFYGSRTGEYFSECTNSTTFDQALRQAFEGLGISLRTPTQKTTVQYNQSGKLDLFVGKVDGNRGRTSSEELAGQDAQFQTPEDAFKFISASDRNILICIDEVTEVAGENGRQLIEKLAYLARMMSNQTESVKNSRLILCGLPSLTDRLLEVHQSIARNVETIELEPLTDKDLSELLKYANHRLGIDLPNILIRTLIDEAGGFPYFIHVMGAAACEIALSRGEKKTVSMKDYANAFHRQYQIHRPSIHQIYGKKISQLGREEKERLRIIAGWSKYSFSEKDLEEVFRASSGELKGELRRIETQLADYFRKRRSGQKLCFRTPFLKAYCRERFGISRYWGGDSAQLPLFPH